MAEFFQFPGGRKKARTPDPASTEEAREEADNVIRPRFGQPREKPTSTVRVPNIPKPADTVSSESDVPDSPSSEATSELESLFGSHTEAFSSVIESALRSIESDFDGEETGGIAPLARAHRMRQHIRSLRGLGGEAHFQNNVALRREAMKHMDTEFLLTQFNESVEAEWNERPAYYMALIHELTARGAL